LRQILGARQRLAAHRCGHNQGEDPLQTVAVALERTKDIWNTVKPASGSFRNSFPAYESELLP